MTSSYITLVDAYLRTTPDAGERAVYLNRELEQIEIREARTGADLSRVRAALLERLEAVRTSARASIAAARAASPYVCEDPRQ